MIAPTLVRTGSPSRLPLNEIARLGSSEAALDLSKVVGRGIRIEAARMLIVRIGELQSLIGLRGESVVAVYLCAQGDMRGTVLLLLSVDGGRALVDMMRNLPPGSTASLGTIERSALGEVGKLTSGFVYRSLSNAAGLEARLSPPAVMVTRESTLLEATLVEPLDPTEDVLAMDVVFADDRRQVKAIIALVPEAPPLTALLEVLERNWQSR